MNTQDRDNVTI